ncbi:MAG: T9SS type A sorting domain-containing protein [Bacteroidales bacterium]
MRFFFIIITTIGILLFIAINANAQFIPKISGICIRNDDNQSKNEFQQYASVFDAHGLKFCFALNLAQLNPYDNSYINTIDTLISHGHEMMDHTPNHHTQYFTVRNLSDTSIYSSNPGVDHINQTKICLKIDSIHTNSYNDEGFVIINGNRVISTLPGEFKNFTIGNPVQCIFIPALNKLCSYYNISNINVNDPDTIYLKTFWEETLTNTFNGITTYKKLSLFDVFINKNSISLLLNQTKKYCNELGFTLPKTWIQPGGYFPRFTKNEIHEAGEQLGYKAAATYLNVSLKFFNEFDPLKNQRYSLQGDDFSCETQTFKSIKTTIADGIARNKVLIETNHFGHYDPLLGNWNAFLQRTDSLLSWCNQKNILVKTYKDWAPILYDSIPNPYQNIFPSLTSDLDEDGFPDGYNKTYIGNINSSGGVQTSSGFYLNRTLWGHLCVIFDLGGIEKGKNILEFYTKGNPNDSINLKITYRQSNINDLFFIKANTTTWKKQKIEFNCPDSISTIHLDFLANITFPNVKLSGMTLRKKSILTVLPDTTISTDLNLKFWPINLKNIVKDPFFDKDSLRFSIIKVTKLIATIDSLKNLIVHKPTPLWQGNDTIWVKVQNPDESTDTIRFFYKSTQKNICKGDSLYIISDFYSTPSQIVINSIPFDSSLTYTSSGLFQIAPKTNTRYILKWSMPSGLIQKDSIQINIYTVQLPVLSLNGNNPFCSGDSVKLVSSPNLHKTNLFRNDTLISINESLINFSTTKSGDYYITQIDQNTCKNKSSITTLTHFPEIILNINKDTIIYSNIDTIVLLSQISNSISADWSTFGDGILTVLPNQKLRYCPGIYDHLNGHTTLYVTARGQGNCSTVKDSIVIFYCPQQKKPNMPIGPDTLCVNNFSTYIITGFTNSVSFHWNIFPSNAGSMNGNDSIAIVNWNSNFTGIAQIIVNGIDFMGGNISFIPLTVRVYPTTIAGSISGGGNICLGNSTGLLKLNGFSGNILKWQKKYNNGIWIDIANTSTLYSEIPTSLGICEYRAQVQTGVCNPVFSVSAIVNIEDFPLNPGLISGNSIVWQGQNAVLFSVSGISNAVSYIWTLPNGANGNSLTNNITINFDTTANSGNISVKASNTCGNSQASIFPITVNPLVNNPSTQTTSSLKLTVNSNLNTYTDEMYILFTSNAIANQGVVKWFSIIPEAPSIYSVKNNTYFTINNLPSVFDNLIVPINFSAGVNGIYSITASELSSFTSPVYIYLKDLKTNYIQLLNQNSIYNFSCVITDSPFRFELIFSLNAIRWFGNISNDWSNSANWVNNSLPNSTDNIVINNWAARQPNITSNSGVPTICKNLTINTGASLTINAGKALTVNENLINNAGVTGLVLKSDNTGTASLIHNSSGINASVECYISHTNTDEFHTLTSSVSNQSISPVYNEINGFFAWDETKGIWIDFADSSNFSTANNNTTYFIPGKAYAVSYPNIVVKSFSGILNQGNINIPLTSTTGTYKGWNLIGNPFPSPINWNATNGWNRNCLENANGTEKAIWIWNASSGNYGTYISNTSNSIGTNGVTNIIGVSQGFWVKAATNGVLSLNNNVREHSHQQLLKSSNNLINSLRLKVITNENNFSDEIIVSFGFNDDFGGAEKMLSLNQYAPTLYSIKQNKKWSINQLSEINENTLIPIGFKAGVNGNYSIIANDLNSFNPDIFVYIKDISLNTITELNNNSNYSFSATTNDNENRFQLFFTLTPLKVSKNEILNTNIYSYGNLLFINSNESIQRIEIYNTLGEKIMTLSDINRSNTINMNGKSAGYYIVRVLTTTNVYSEKIFVNPKNL